MTPSPGAARNALPRSGSGLFLLVVPLLMLAGCDPRQDPIDKPGTWSLPPAGLTSNDENLRTMLVNPNDLVNGTGTTGSTGSLAAAPVRRLITGQRYKLPSSEGSIIPTGDSSQPNGAGLGAGSAGSTQ